MPIALAALALALAPMPTPALPDADLGTMRGGLALPGGVDLKLTVHSDTRVDGTTVLRTIFRADAGAPTLQVLVGDGTGSGIGAAATGPAVAITRDGKTAELSTAGLTEVALAPGQAIDTVAGRVRLDSLARGARVTLQADALDVSHLVGEGLGSVIANAGDGRTIDTLTTVNIDLSGVSPEALGSAMLRVEGMALDAARAGVR